MQEDRLQVGLDDLDGGDPCSCRCGGCDERRQSGACVFDQQLEHPVALTDATHHGQFAERQSGGIDGAIQTKVDPILLADQLDELAAGALSLDLAGVDDRNPVAEPLRFLHVVGGVEHADARRR